MDDDRDGCPTCDSVLEGGECEHCLALSERLDFDEYRRVVGGAPASPLAVAAAHQVKAATVHFGHPVRAWASDVLRER